VWCLLSDVVCTGQIFRRSVRLFGKQPPILINTRQWKTLSKSWCCAHATSFMAVFVQDYSTSSKKPHRYRWSQIPVAAVSGTSYWFRSPILIGFLGRQNVCPQNPPSREEEETEEEEAPQQLDRCRVTDNDLAMSQNYIEPPKLIAFINQIDLLKKNQRNYKRLSLLGPAFVGKGAIIHCLCGFQDYYSQSWLTRYSAAWGKCLDSPRGKPRTGRYFCLISSSWFHPFPDVCPSFQVLDDHSMSAADWSVFLGGLRELCSLKPPQLV